MKATEIKINNLVWILGEERKVETISNLPARGDMYWVGTEGLIDVKMIHVRGIPLTEEKLLELGFEKVLDFFTKHAGSNVMSIYCFESFSRVQIVTQTICSIKYVHELQNLYFAITGEELVKYKKPL